MDKQDTPNSRLARVLRILADVADANPPWLLVEGKPFDCAISAIFAGSHDHAEGYATEAARLAGVPVPLPAPYRPEETTDGTL